MGRLGEPWTCPISRSKRGLAESLHTPSAAINAKRIPGNKFKSTMDCVNGYHGIKLVEADRHKTTFATEWGKFRYRRAPQGYLSSGDSYSRHTDTIMEDCPSTTSDRDFLKIVDDIITHFYLSLTYRLSTIIFKRLRRRAQAQQQGAQECDHVGYTLHSLTYLQTDILNTDSSILSSLLFTLC